MESKGITVRTPAAKSMAQRAEEVEENVRRNVATRRVRPLERGVSRSTDRIERRTTEERRG